MITMDITRSSQENNSSFIDIFGNYEHQLPPVFKNSSDINQYLLSLYKNEDENSWDNFIEHQASFVLAEEQEVGDMDDMPSSSKECVGEIVEISWLHQLNDSHSSKFQNIDFGNINYIKEARDWYFKHLWYCLLQKKGDSSFYIAHDHLKKNPFIHHILPALEFFIVKLMKDNSRQDEIKETVLILRAIYSLLHNSILPLSFINSLMDALMFNLIHPVSRCNSGGYSYLLKDLIADVIVTLLERYYSENLLNETIIKLSFSFNYENPFPEYGAVALSLCLIENFMDNLSSLTDDSGEQKCISESTFLCNSILLPKIYSCIINNTSLKVQKCTLRQSELKVRNKLVFVFKCLIRHWFCSNKPDSNFSEFMRFLTTPDIYIADFVNHFCKDEIFQYCVLPSKYMLHRMPPQKNKDPLASLSRYLFTPSKKEIDTFNINLENDPSSNNESPVAEFVENDSFNEPFMSEWFEFKFKCEPRHSGEYFNHDHCMTYHCNESSGEDETLFSGEDETLSSGEDETLSSREDEASSSGEDKTISSGEDKIISSGEDKIISSDKDKTISFGEDKIMSSEEDKIMSSEEDKIMSSAEDKIMSSEEDKIMSSEEDKSMSSEEDKSMSSMSDESNSMESQGFLEESTDSSSLEREYDMSKLDEFFCLRKNSNRDFTDDGNDDIPMEVRPSFEETDSFIISDEETDIPEKTFKKLKVSEENSDPSNDSRNTEIKQNKYSEPKPSTSEQECENIHREEKFSVGFKYIKSEVFKLQVTVTPRKFNIP